MIILQESQVLSYVDKIISSFKALAMEKSKFQFFNKSSKD
jgi:hypothetical protein